MVMVPRWCGGFRSRVLGIRRRRRRTRWPPRPTKATSWLRRCAARPLLPPRTRQPSLLLPPGQPGRTGRSIPKRGRTAGRPPPTPGWIFLRPSRRPQSPPRGALADVVGRRPAGWPEDLPGQRPEPRRPRRGSSRDSRGLAGLLTTPGGTAGLDRRCRPSPGSAGRRGEAGGPVDVGLILEFAVAGDSGFGRQPIQLDGTHARQDFCGGRNRLDICDQGDFKRGPLGGGLVRVGDGGFPLSLTCHLINFLPQGSPGGFILACLIFVVRCDVTNQHQALRKRAVECDVESVSPGDCHEPLLLWFGCLCGRRPGLRATSLDSARSGLFSTSSIVSSPPSDPPLVSRISRM